MSEIILPISVLSGALAYGAGVGPVPNTLLGEIIPIRIKSVATAIIISIK